MKSKGSIFIAGLVIGILVVSSMFSVADSMTKEITVQENMIKVEVDGKVVEGDNFLYNNTTYVPLRLVAEMLGCEVGWDGRTNTASIISSKEESSPPISQTGLSEEAAKEPAETLVISITYETTIVSNNSVGNEWYSDLYYNGETISQPFNLSLKADQSVAFEASVMEYDEGSSDYGKASVTIKASDFNDGKLHEYTRDITVAEDGGRYKGNKAVVKFKIIATPQ